MTEQPNQRPEGTGPADSSPSYEPPGFIPPQGPEIPPPPFSQGQHGPDQHGQGQYGPDQYGQAPYGQDPYNQSQYAQGYAPGPAGSPYAQPGQYGQPMYYGMQPQPKGLSIASMVLGIVSVLIGFIMVTQIAAIITGHLALKREPAGKGMSITGLVLGYLCLLGYGAFWLLLIVGLGMYESSYNY